MEGAWGETFKTHHDSKPNGTLDEFIFNFSHILCSRFGGGLVDFDDVSVVVVDGFWSGCRGLSLICRLCHKSGMQIYLHAPCLVNYVKYFLVLNEDGWREFAKNLCFSRAS